MNVDQLIGILSKETLEGGIRLDPDAIIVSAIQSDLEKALNDTSEPPAQRNGPRAAAKVYLEHIKKFESQAAARNDALNRIQKFREQSEAVEEAEHRLHGARAEMDQIADAKLRIISIDVALTYLDGNLHDLTEELSGCTADAIKAIHQEAAGHLVDSLPSVHRGHDMYARHRHNRLLDLVSVAEQRKAILAIAIKEVTKRGDELKAEKAELEKQLVPQESKKE
jgi:hypothetical protein